MFKAFRVVLLLIVLVSVAFYSKFQKLESTAWVEPLSVVVYPINGDGSSRAAQYISNLQSKDFAPIDRFLTRVSEPYGLVSRQLSRTQLGIGIDEQPPLPDFEAGTSTLKSIWWSLRLRYWASQYEVPQDTDVAVQMFVLYYDPKTAPKLPHSLGLQKGLIGVVHAFADRDYQASNQVVIAHELLHTLGATDKYDRVTGEPSYPDGYARQLGPRFPQTQAEIMGGRIPLSATDSKMPDSLRNCVVGRLTALEINWLSSGAQ